MNASKICIILRFAHEHFFISDDDEKSSEPPASFKKMLGYAENIVPDMTDKQFQTHFRISASTFEVLLNMVHSFDSNETAGQPQLELDKQLMITIWFLANLECLR